LNFEDIKLLKLSDGVVSLALNRPGKRNALSENMIKELVTAINIIGKDNECRLIKLEGEGEVFCAGGDLEWMKEQANSTREKRINEARKLAKMFRILNSVIKPILGVIRGDAYGGGIGLISICDYSISSSAAKFGLTESRLGLIPATISPYVISRIGESNCRDIFLSGEIFNAEKANKIGLVNEVVKPSDLEKSVDSYISFFKKTSRQAVSSSKALIQTLRPKVSDKLIDETARRLADTWESNDAQKGIKGFLDKSKVIW
tara:strand:- start:1153 stop:1932 length:780 start_codon:yes stop_codon:yes gene_type:complete